MGISDEEIERKAEAFYLADHKFANRTPEDYFQAGARWAIERMNELPDGYRKIVTLSYREGSHWPEWEEITK